ncbi:MAG: hypothetical protein C4549_04355 [Deltaproteobacteria bacterium]|jgi:transcriptional regulator with PAS, ATPase and Fis domain|nr:MAG: hypothetical protein C4549_04355 [Deltaproteobacteria bacterium]
MNQYRILEGILEESEAYQHRSNPELPDWTGEILEDMDIGVFIVDRTFRFANSTSFVERLLKRTRDALIGEYLFDVIPLFDIPEWRGKYADVLTNGSTFKNRGVSYQGTPKDKEKPENIFLNISLYPFTDRQNEIVGVVTALKGLSSIMKCNA